MFVINIVLEGVIVAVGDGVLVTVVMGWTIVPTGRMGEGFGSAICVQATTSKPRIIIKEVRFTY